MRGRKADFQLGIRASSTCVLAFDDMKIPKENIVGEIGKGYKVCARRLRQGRVDG